MLSTISRPKIKQFMKNYHFDVLIIGGGVTGAGIALDAVTRGLSVALVDMQDFAAGTSSRSTKLIHGGLRYLKQLELKIVAETGREREIVYRNAMHVTEPEWMLLPFYKGGTFGKTMTSAGLFAYDLLAGVKKDERREMLSRAETIKKEPLLNTDGLVGGGHYVEYRTDDARLTIEIMKKASEQGALCLNYMMVEDFLWDEDKIAGAIVKDMKTDECLDIHASVIINATGPWVDSVREKADVSNNKKLRLTKGIHIVIDQSIFPLQQAIYFDAPDGRMIFAIPRGSKTYIGTTDTFFDGDPTQPKATVEDVNYLLDAIRQLFPTIPVDQASVESTWAGVRPLIFEEGQDPSEISRKDEIWTAPSGLITIAGGKLTGYRKMAEHVVDRIVKQLDNASYTPCITEHLLLSGGDFDNDSSYQSFVRSKGEEARLFGLTKADGEELAAFYGTNVDILFNYAHALQTSCDFKRLPLRMKAEILYAIHYEMAMTPSDYFIRRKGELYFNINHVEKYKEAVSLYMAKLLSVDEARRKEQYNELEMNLATAKSWEDVIQ